jgi:hypothetical protein
MLHVNIFIDTTGITNVKPLGGVMVSVLSLFVLDQHVKCQLTETTVHV